jgi:hypothetical protein
MAWHGVAGVAGLEPVTSAVTGQRSNQLSYTPNQGIRKVKKPFLSVNRQMGELLKINDSGNGRQGGGGGEPR